MNQLAIAILRIPLCAICKQPLSKAETKLQVTAHFDCVWLDAMTSPSNKGDK